MKQTFKSPVGTSFHDTVIRTTINKLTKVLGRPDYFSNDGKDKVNIEWRMETENGDVFTVYDYKEYRPLDFDEIIEFHIGGMSGKVTYEAFVEISNELDKFKDEWDAVIEHYKGTVLSHWHHFEEWEEENQSLLNFLKKFYDAPVAKPLEEIAEPEIEDVDYYTINVFHVNYKGTEYVVRWNEDYDDDLVQEWDVLDEDGTLPPIEIVHKLIDYCTPKVKTIKS